MDELDGFSLKVRQYPKKKLPYQILKSKPAGDSGNFQAVRPRGFEPEQPPLPLAKKVCFCRPYPAPIWNISLSLRIWSGLPRTMTLLFGCRGMSASGLMM